MLKRAILCCCTLFYMAFAEPPVQGVKPSNVLGSSDQHASFSFIRPGLTQTAFAFSGPSSHQSFSSSVGNPHLVQKVHPNLAHALAYRNPGLGLFPSGPVAHGFATAPAAPAYVQPSPVVPYPYQATLDPTTALAYYQQMQQIQQNHMNGYSPAVAAYQAQLAQLLALRQAQAQAQSQVHLQATQPQRVPEQVQLQAVEQQQPESQNLLGVAYSSAPSVAHVKVSGNGYKFDF